MLSQKLEQVNFNRIQPDFPRDLFPIDSRHTSYHNIQNSSTNFRNINEPNIAGMRSSGMPNSNPNETGYNRHNNSCSPIALANSSKVASVINSWNIRFDGSLSNFPVGKFLYVITALTTDNLGGYSPYYVLFGYPMITHGGSYKLLEKLDRLEDGEEVNHADKLLLIRDRVKQNLELAYNKYKKPYNLRSRDIQYDEGDEIYRRNFVLSKKSENFNSKLAPKWLKCKIVKRLGNSCYSISDLQGKVIGLYHAKDLKPG